MALASRLAGPDNAVQSLPSSDSWLSEKNKKIPGACSCASCVSTLHVLVESSYILEAVATFWIWIVNKHASITVACRALRAPLFDKGVLCTAYKKRGEEARGFTTVRGAPQNGDGRTCVRQTEPQEILCNAMRVSDLGSLFVFFEGFG